MSDRFCVEYLWAYDWWLSWKENNNEYHRIDESLVLETKQPIKYWPVFFKTEKWYFKNLTPITKEKYDSINKKQNPFDEIKIKSENLRITSNEK